MSKKFLFFGLVLSLIFNGAFFFKRFFPQVKKENSSVVISRVVDGDTLVAEKGYYIRLAGIDAPEYPAGCLSTEAKEKLEQLVLGQKLSLQEIKKDHFGRTLGFLFLDNVLINQILVEEGLAQAEGDNLAYSSSLSEAEQKAKTLQRGIWSLQCLNPDCRIKGNVRKDRNTKIYHLPHCYNYEKIVIDQSEGDRWFCTEQEAIEAGFAKSGDCPKE